MMNDQWQDNLRNLMERYEEPAPDGLWEDIDRLITGNSTVGEMPAKPKYTVRGIYIGVFSAVATAAILLLLILRYTSSENQKEVRFTEKNSPIVSQNEQPLGENILGENSVESLLSLNKPVLKRQLIHIEAATQLAAKQNEAFTTREEGKEDISRDSDKNSDEVPEKDADQPVPDFSHAGDQLFVSAARKPTRNHSGWQTSLSMSNLPAGSSETYPGYGTFALAENVEEQYHFMSNYTREQVYTNVKHHQPITFGLTLRYNFNERWSMASGLTYSLLSSELYSGNGNYYYDDRQTLHYIGIPVNIAYIFWQNDKISTYFSTGGLVEKNVAGRLTSNYYLDNQLEISTREKITTRELQWSVNAATGFEYQISNHIGLYAEPGISYYFRNSSELETIYKDNPLHFNLSLGLRFTINK
jgi:hypothetical protein